MTILLDLAAALIFVTYIWSWVALSYRLAWTIVDFVFDEIDFYYERKYPDVDPINPQNQAAVLESKLLYANMSPEQVTNTEQELVEIKAFLEVPA
jgi:hypothetical protein